MKKVVLSTLIGMSIAAVSGCATLSKEECLVADWHAIGKQDGREGYTWQRLSEHAKACSKINIIPNKEQWEAGRQEGLKSYCTVSNAYAKGLRGKFLNDVCTENRYELMDVSYSAIQVYEKHLELQAIKKERDKAQTELRKLINGENLDFKTEKEARAYMAKLPTIIQQLERKMYLLDNETDDLRNQSIRIQKNAIRNGVAP